MLATKTIRPATNAKAKYSPALSIILIFINFSRVFSKPEMLI